MIDKPKREETILFNGNFYRTGDIVMVREMGILPKNLTGKITKIDTMRFTLDTSKKYESNLRLVEYEDVISMEYVEDSENETN